MVRTKQGPEERTKDKVEGTKRVTKSGKVFELDERTALFGEAAIKLAGGSLTQLLEMLPPEPKRKAKR